MEQTQPSFCFQRWKDRFSWSRIASYSQMGYTTYSFFALLG
jgi:hypothetical protein